MAGITKIPSNKSVKALVVGESGGGKTGMLAALACLGYKLRILSIDKGTKILYTLLTDEHYPYAKWMRDHGINIDEAVEVVNIDMNMTFEIATKELPGGQKIQETVWRPKDASAWTKLSNMLTYWRDGDSNYGKIITWDDRVVLVIDPYSHLCRAAYYWSQSINNRLGVRDDGFSYQKDVGTAQSQLKRMLEMYNDSHIMCNIILITHVSPIDDSRGFVQSPGQIAIEGRTPNVKGFPMAIGRAMAKEIGTYFNDLYVVKQEGSSHKIYTVPIDEISTKTSVWLERSYDVRTGLAEIFAAHRNEPLPDGFLSSLNSHASNFQASTSVATKPTTNAARPASLQPLQRRVE